MTAELVRDGQLPPPPLPKWQIYSIIGVVLILVAGAVTYFAWPRDTSRCAADAPLVKQFSTPDGTRCAGLTDAGFPFSKDLSHVSELIKKENDAVTQEAATSGGTPYVSVVYLLNLVPGKQDTNSVSSVRHEIEGAYTAQIEANHHRTQGNSPHIRLLLGNIGSQPTQRDYTLDQIRSHRNSDRIVAAAGLGTSQTATKAMVSRLTAWDIASFGAVLTADELQQVHGLVRAAPPNADEAAAAVQFLKMKKYATSTVLIIQDANQRDLYTKTLAMTFRSRFPKSRLAADEPMQYDSSKTQLATYFSNQMANLCAGHPDVVYFAGRGHDLPDFLAPLADRQCNTTELTVLSGDDVSGVGHSAGFDDVKRALQNGNIRLVYTGLAHPGAWHKAPQFYSPNAIVPFQEDGTFFAHFPNDTLDDGQAIMAYDAMLTAVKAIRKAVPLENSDQPVERTAVMQMLTLLNDANAIAGASGWISYTNNGSPENKAIPVIEVGMSGTTTTIEVTAGSGRPYVAPSSADQ